MKPEKQHLLDELRNGGGGQQREETLRAGAVILRRRRWKRAAAQGTAAAMAVILGGMLAERTLTQQPTTAPAIAQVAAPKLKYLTDEELLAMFPDAPVGLAKAGESKRLIFLNPADEKRYVARM